jgi:hypothetical protein
MHKMQNMHGPKCAEYAKCMWPKTYKICTISSTFKFSTFLKKCVKTQWTPSQDPKSSAEVHHICHIFKKNAKSGTKVLILWKYVGQLASTCFSYVKSRQKLWPRERLQKGMAVAMVLSQVGNSSTLCIAFKWQLVP